MVATIGDLNKVNRPQEPSPRNQLPVEVKLSSPDREASQRDLAKAERFETVTVDKGGWQSFFYNFAGMVTHERFSEKRVPVTDTQAAGKPKIDPLVLSQEEKKSDTPPGGGSAGGRRPEEEQARIGEERVPVNDTQAAGASKTQ